jgi:hypothetical protein
LGATTRLRQKWRSFVTFGVVTEFVTGEGVGVWDVI